MFNYVFFYIYPTVFGVVLCGLNTSDGSSSPQDIWIVLVSPKNNFFAMQLILAMVLYTSRQGNMGVFASCCAFYVGSLMFTPIFYLEYVSSSRWASLFCKCEILWHPKFGLVMFGQFPLLIGFIRIFLGYIWVFNPHQLPNKDLDGKKCLGRSDSNIKAFDTPKMRSKRHEKTWWVKILFQKLNTEESDQSDWPRN